MSLRSPGRSPVCMMRRFAPASEKAANGTLISKVRMTPDQGSITLEQCVHCIGVPAKYELSPPGPMVTEVLQFGHQKNGGISMTSFITIAAPFLRPGSARTGKSPGVRSARVPRPTKIKLADQGELEAFEVKQHHLRVREINWGVQARERRRRRSG
jgi:hypothetical protein